MENMPVPMDQDIQEGIDGANYDYVEKFISLSGMSGTMSDILRTEMMAYVSESPHPTGQQIADTVGCSVVWVYQCRKDARYLAAKDKIQDMWFQSQAGSVYQAVLDTARQGKVGAQKLALEVMGKHVTRIESKNVNVNADMVSGSDLNLDKAIDKFLIMIGNRGWSLEMIADRWRVLKQTQAF